MFGVEGCGQDVPCSYSEAVSCGEEEVPHFLCGKSEMLWLIPGDEKRLIYPCIIRLIKIVSIWILCGPFERSRRGRGYELSRRGR